MTTVALAQPLDVVEATVDLTPAEARALTDGIRRDLDAIATAVHRAFTGRAWIALGYTSWQQYIEVELGDALTGLVKSVRRDVVGVLSDAGVSARAMAPLMGMKSDQSIRNDLRTVRPDGVTGARLGADGKAYTRTALAAPTPMLAIAGPKKTETTLELLEQAGPDGYTIPELARKKKWSYSEAGATLSRLNRSRDRDGLRKTERLAERRGGHSPYVLPWHVDARPVLEPGQRLPRA